MLESIHIRRYALIRDEEIERAIAFYLTPLFEKAGLDVHNMSIHLVKDDSINAFAARGLHVFIHTGLLLKADNAQEVIAVLAHETGHIAGGHIVRLYENMRIAQRSMLLSMILGAVAAAAGRGGSRGGARKIHARGGGGPRLHARGSRLRRPPLGHAPLPGPCPGDPFWHSPRA